ncbi:prephenate dehydrogenase [Streptomyces montanus]|uniref:Prephenate dehydrogenase n=1 Tax=Streptomyces montanus TaxID=2580423 RepID=A0A5R9G7T4_9ACTN|nr:prephenate dehydrogenase [Streptomyces montanus]TLS47535.1 prephenate dehydrogenase [Streptomyces montanus]
MIRTTAIVGTGLIGTSVGLALTSRGVDVHLIDTDERSARVAAALGAGTVGAPSQQVDIAVLAVPPQLIGEVLAEQRARGLARAYTDVASVKDPASLGLPSGHRPADYVGGHPMAGGERAGPLAARRELFEDRTWVLTPSPDNSQSVLNGVLELVALCKAVPVVMDSAEHDRAIALVSHTPHLVSSLMAACIQEAPREAVRLGGLGLRDITRIAGGDPQLWTEILRANASAVAEVLGGLAKQLDSVLSALHDLALDDPQGRQRALSGLEDLLYRGQTGASAVRGRVANRGTRAETVSVAVADRPGDLRRLLSVVEEFDRHTTSVSVVQSTEPSGLQLQISAPPLAAGLLEARLEKEGWNILVPA